MNNPIEVISGQRDGMIRLEIPLNMLRDLESYFTEVEEKGTVLANHKFLKEAIEDAVEQAELGGVKSSQRRDIDWYSRHNE